jgi:AGZA family xanthine/uracil permease-like MFS transporter
MLERLFQRHRHGTSVGIGLLVAFIGLQNLGLVQLGAFTPQALLGLCGLLVAILLESRRIRGAILPDILTTAAGAFLLVSLLL